MGRLLPERLYEWERKHRKMNVFNIVLSAFLWSKNNYVYVLAIVRDRKKRVTQHRSLKCTFPFACYIHSVVDFVRNKCLHTVRKLKPLISKSLIGTISNIQSIKLLLTAYWLLPKMSNLYAFLVRNSILKLLWF